MKRKSPNPGPNIYEVLDPLSGLHQEAVEEETMTRIQGMMLDQKRAQKRRALPELEPVWQEEPQAETKTEHTDDDARTDLVPASPVAPAPVLWTTQRSLRPRLGLFLVLCLLFFSGFMSTALLLTIILAVLLILIFGPEPVLDAVFPNWRKAAIDFGKMRLNN